MSEPSASEPSARDPTVRERLRENAVGIASTAVTGIWMAAFFTGQEWWLAALIVGYAAVIPLVAQLFGDDEDREEWVDDWTADERDREESASGDAGSADRGGDGETPLETLRRRYASGELTDEQFERKLERLLETETLEDVEDRAAVERELERDRG
ncbi:hypothetical protein GCM10027435_27860 [Haloparvum alkalitolerans]|uniref:SHOCT domain-containing protein n=1 Tax=Haloparvum alkalitolerans TaxID=1042953 RepID=UPI003CE9966A